MDRSAEKLVSNRYFMQYGLFTTCVFRATKRARETNDEIASSLPEVKLVKSIPGIGDKLAVAIVAEIGDVRQFKDAKQLVAFAGLDPGIFSSGKFTATSSADYKAWI